MRVALLTREYPPEVYGGAGVHVEYLSRHLARLVDIGVHCFGAPRDSPLVDAAYQPWDQIPADGHGSALRTMSVDLLMAAGVEGAELVHSHTWYANLAGHLAKLLYDIPHVMTAHSLEPFRPWKAEQLGAGYALSSFCERTAIDAADAVIAVSEAMRADILKAYPATEPERIHVIHNGIDPDEYKPDPATDVLDRFGVDPNRPTVIFVGRVTRQKGIIHLLDAASYLEPDTQLVLCAGAPDTPEIGAETRKRVSELERERGGVVWIEQMLPRPEIVQLLSHATVFVCPSVYEPFGLINVEAMACELPVVATAIGGIPEIVVDGETGYLVPFEAGGDVFGTPLDPAGLARDLADRINDLFADRHKAMRFGRAGRQRVLDHFSWQMIAEQTVQLYRECGRDHGSS
jgi:starch synthase